MRTTAFILFSCGKASTNFESPRLLASNTEFLHDEPIATKLPCHTSLEWCMVIGQFDNFLAKL